MADRELKSKANIGSSSLILIFIVLCLATFGLLSLSSARGDLALAQKNAEAVRGYYEADEKGEEFYHMADREAAEALASGAASRDSLLRERLGDYYQSETGNIVTEVPMERGQALRIELTPDERRGCLAVLEWKVINKEDYEIDNSMPVWTGDTGNETQGEQK